MKDEKPKLVDSFSLTAEYRKHLSRHHALHEQGSSLCCPEVMFVKDLPYKANAWVFECTVNSTKYLVIQSLWWSLRLEMWILMFSTSRKRLLTSGARASGDVSSADPATRESRMGMGIVGVCRDYRQKYG